MKILVIAALAAAVLVPNIGNAQVRVHAFPLISIDSLMKADPSASKWRVCGHYFAQMKVGDKYNPIITFVSHEGEDRSLAFMRRDKFVVLLDPTAKSPTGVVRLQTTDPKIPFRWIISMNANDARAAQPCLPAPGKDPDGI